MSIDEHLLKIISNEVKDEICMMDVITPEVFKTMFAQHAKEHQTELDQETQNSYTEGRIATLLNLNKQTSDNAIRLSQSTSKAIDAIRQKDESALSFVLGEVNEFKKEIEKLKESLYKDELTGAYNRKWLHDTFFTNDENRFAKSGFLAVIDLNYFKQINDTFGHIIGDKVLIFIVNQLRRSGASVVRYGGDEFLLLFANPITHEAVATRLESLRKNILKKHLQAKEDSFKVSFSFGITSYNANEHLSTVLEKADMLMYQDKELIKKKVTGIFLS